MDVKDLDSPQHSIRSELGFKPQNELKYNKFLPYASDLDDESNKMFAEIKANLGKSVMMKEIRPGCGVWSSRLVRYIQLYGFKFSREDHIALVKLMYECVTIPKLEPYLVHKFAQVLFILLKKKYLLTPDVITLDWKPLYEVVKRIMDSSHTELGMYRFFTNVEHALDSLVHVARYYFPESATQEILDEARPNLYPLNGPNDLDIFEWFLPVALPPEKSDVGFELWLTDIMDMWSVCNNSPAWEHEAMNLIAKLASHNIGYIDWEPFIPDMFCRFLVFTNLPVNYKNLEIKKQKKLETSSIALWIVSTLGGGSSCQKHLDKFLVSVESYFHPANHGRWVRWLRALLWKLPQYFIERLHFERYDKKSWLTPVPDSNKLTEEDIDRFVESLKPAVMQAVFSKTGYSEVCMALQHLATLRPKMIIPDLIEKLYSTLGSLTEPHKLTSVMQCIIGVARPLVQGPSMGYKEGPLHVIPMLMATLPGIDPNDFRKCIVTFQFIQTFVTQIPIVDCSKVSETWADLSEEEEELCALTASFEDFVCQFFERVFILVDSSSLEITRFDKNEDKRSRVEKLAEKVLTAVCLSLLNQTSPEIFQSALRKLQSFVTSRILETNVAGHFIASLCTAFARVNCAATFKALLPHLCNSILTLTESVDVQKEDNLDGELLYNLLVLSAVVDCRREGLMPYIPQLMNVLDRCLYLASREGCATASRLLRNMFVTLTSIGPNEHRSVNYPIIDNDKDHLLIRDWGKPGNIHNLNLSWHVPNADEISAAQALLNRYFIPELERIRKHIEGKETLTRFKLLMSLSIISAMEGAESMLPFWDEPPLALLDSCLEVKPLKITLGSSASLTMPDGGNVRKVIADTINKLQLHLLETAQDDTKALLEIIKITERLILNKTRVGGDYDAHHKNHHLIKKVLMNQLLGKKSTIRTLIVNRVILQHEARCEKAGACMTETHRILMLNLLSLACSHYSQVRTRAQQVLSQAVDFFPYSYTVLLPKLVENLKLDSSENHEIIKGSLHVILGPKQSPILTRHDWSLLLQLWPALIRSQPSEKLSVVHLMENMRDSVFKHFPTITIALDFPDKCSESARELWRNKPLPAFPIVTESEIESGKQALVNRNKLNLDNYLKLLDSLTAAAEDNNLHWRHHAIAVGFIRDLVHPDVPYPARTVRLILNNLISDSIEVRKISIRSSVFLLKLQKRPHKKVTVNLETISSLAPPEKPMPGIRPDNAWLQYNSQKLPKTSAAWDSQPYYHSIRFGYLQCPKQIKLYAPSFEQPKLDRLDSELSDAEMSVVHFFSNPKNISKMVEYLSLEDRKGQDKFNAFRFMLFKSLFRNHGDKFVPLFVPHLERLVSDNLESSQRCAAEIIVGMIRGSKHWPFEKVEALWKTLIPIIQTALARMTEETLGDWGVCFATASQNRDPNRNYWLLECLIEDPLRNETSFMNCGRLYVLQSALNQQDWRLSELSTRLLDIILPYLDHRFENVRRRIASVLTNIFMPNVSLPGGTAPGPHLNDFIVHIDKRLEILYSLSLIEEESVKRNSIQGSSSLENSKIKVVMAKNGISKENSETDAALRLFKTTLLWITGTLTRSNACVLSAFYKIYPLMCLLESYDQDDDLGLMCSKALAALSAVPVTAEQLPSVFSVINKVALSNSWWARKTNLDFLQVVLFYSMPVVSSKPDSVENATKVVLNALGDSRLEVREKAAEVLAGLLHCNFIRNTAQLLKEFTKRIGRKGRRDLKDPAEICALHSGMLGLCAFINSSPYSVPDCVPEIFAILGDHLNDPQPIPSTIRKTLGDFHRTHYDNWENHKLKFTDSQLEVFSDLSVPPSYCV